MSRYAGRALAAALACLATTPRPGFAGAPTPAASTATPTTSTDTTNIFVPERAPLIILHIGARRIVLAPLSTGSGATITSQAIANRANSTSFSKLIAATVAGAAQSASGELHIRGSHGQYTYYLDGAPLPSSVSGSFTDLIDPKYVDTLRVYTGGFPARYGGNLAAVFDVTAKGGRPGPPTGYVQQEAQGYETYNSTAEAGGGAGTVSYFLSGVRDSTDRRLDPPAPRPLHDAGMDSVVFARVDSRLSPSDRLIVDAARTDAVIQIPNTPDRQAVGQDDRQLENGMFGNVIWRRTSGLNSLVTALYSHASRLRFDGSPADLIPSDGETAGDLISTFENQSANYAGLRADYAARHGKRHTVEVGFDLTAITGDENFLLLSGSGDPPLADQRQISGSDESAYVSELWTPGRLTADVGIRYDRHKESITTSQWSPRVNLTYALSGRDRIHAYYDRLFQPAAIEDVRDLSGQTAIGQAVVAPIHPERDDFYEIGYLHEERGATFGLSAYYKTEKDVIDDQPLGNSQITVPFNVTKGYVRGVEASVDAPLGRDATGYVNFARAWAYAAGEITGGIFQPGPPLDYFPDDHDQTNTASVGIDYNHAGAFASLDGEYGSGFPFQDDSGAFRRVSPHFIFNVAAGKTWGGTQLAVTVQNVLNHGYVIKQAGTFTDQEFGQPRTYGIRLTQSY